MAKRADVIIEAEDGYPLEVTSYSPIRRDHFPAVNVINSGAGIPKAVYEPFAGWLADHGLPTFIYDYRGIGGSRGRSIRSLAASIRDWGSKDCAAVLHYCQTLYPESKTNVVGHSIGGIVTGFVTSPFRIGRFLFISPHTGYLGDYAPSKRLKMLLMWHGVMPLLTSVVGYFPGRAFGLPEDLPAGVATEWAKRRFIWNLTYDAGFGSFSQICTQVLTLRPSDDLFATRAAMTRVKSHFNKANFIDVPIPAAKSKNKIGHFGFFHPRSRDSLWPIALSWLEFGIVQAE